MCIWHNRHAAVEVMDDVAEEKLELAETREPKWQQQKKTRCRMLQLREAQAHCSGLLSRKKSRKQTQLR
jgi:hypothetical protein